MQVAPFFTLLITYQMNNLNIFKKNELESTFIKVVNPKKLILLWESFTDIHLWILLT